MGKSHYTDASAGTGKTYSLTHKVAHLIKSGTLAPEKAIIPTFTKAAAAELKTRTRGVLYSEKAFDAADRFDRSFVGTIDSLAFSFIQRYWQALGLSPGSRVIEEDATKTYASEFLHEGIINDDDHKLFNDIFLWFKPTEFVGGKNDFNYNFWRDDILNIVNAAIANGKAVEELSADAKTCVSVIKDVIGNGKSRSDMNESVNELVSVTRDYLESVKDPSKKTNKRRFELVNILEKSEFLSSSWSVAYDELSKDTTIKKKCKVLIPLTECQEVCQRIALYTERIFSIAGKVLSYMDARKVQDHILTFVDIEKYFLNLLDMEGAAKEAVEEDIRSLYSMLFVDEFQDSSSLQVKIFIKLAAILGEENCYFFGDGKQVLYTWRGADVKLTDAIRDSMDSKEILSDSYRSRPEIINFTNALFGKIFSEHLYHGTGREYVLDVHSKKNKAGSLEAWALTEEKVNSKKVPYAKLLATRVLLECDATKRRFSDIAVLARNNILLDSVAKELQAKGVPVNREYGRCADTKEASYILALLRLVAHPNDRMAMAELKNLKEDGYNLNAMIGDILYKGKDWNSEESKYYNNLSQSLINMSISEAVKSLVFGMDIFELEKKWGVPQVRKMNALHIVDEAKKYESKCQQLMLPCTIDGFRTHLRSNKVKSAGNPDGVVLSTFHKSKGLEWPVVVVVENEDDTKDIERIKGVHVLYTCEPTAANPFPDKSVVYFPPFYKFREGTSLTGTAESWMSSIADMEKQESDRLYYVAFTRAKNKLILSTQGNFESLYGIDCDIEEPEGKIFSYLGTDSAGAERRFVIDSAFDVKGLPDNSERSMVLALDRKTYKRVFLKPDTVVHEKRDFSPSQIESAKIAGITPMSIARTISLGESKDRFKNVGLKQEDNVWGDCIHHIFGISKSWAGRDDSAYMIAKLSEQYGVTFDEPSKVAGAWDALIGYFSKESGIGNIVGCFHEYPFIFHDKAGHVFTGNMDLIIESEKGYVIIDYKTFQGARESIPQHIKNKQYGTQIACYLAAIETMGDKPVLGTYIYFPVTRILVEMGNL